MTRLTVKISASEGDSHAFTLPVDACSPEGKRLAWGVASPAQPAQLQLPELPGLRRIYVLGRLPNGAVLQQAVELNGNEVEATLDVREHAPYEWLEWVTPFRELDHLSPVQGTQPKDMRRIGKVWLKLWRFEEGRWASIFVRTKRMEQGAGAKLVSLELSQAPHLLQVGGEDVAWRLVSLPPGGSVRVAVTRSAGDQGDSVDVTIGRSRPMNELVLSYLSRGAVGEAGRLAEAWKAADVMLQCKREDPISATAGAYVLLKDRRLGQRRDWVDNLVNWFPYLADGPIVAAALALQEETAAEGDIRRNLTMAVQRGLPVFSLGIRTLVETMAAIHQGKKESKEFHTAFLAAQAYARASCSSGAYFAFYGKAPGEPSWQPFFGMDGQPRATRRKGDAGALFFARGPKARVSVNFGGVRVKLPRAPVSAGLAQVLRERQAEAGGELVEIVSSIEGGVSTRVPAFHSTKVAGVSAEETAFLGEFSSQRYILDAPYSNLHRAALMESDVLSLPIAGVERVVSRTPVRVKPSRGIRALTLFDGSE